jgi:hypothetical protein
VNVFPAIVSVPVRAAPTFFDTLKPTLPFPVSLAPDVRVIHESLLTAVHEQPAVVVTCTVGPFPPPAFIDALDGLMEYEQPAWVRVKVLPAIVTVPERAGPALAVTFMLTEPSPLPVDPDLTVIHPALLVAVHAQPAAAVTLTAGAVEAPAPTEAVAGLTA